MMIATLSNRAHGHVDGKRDAIYENGLPSLAQHYWLGTNKPINYCELESK